MGLQCSPCHIACQAEGESHDQRRQQPPSVLQVRSRGLKEQPAQFEITITPTLVCCHVYFQCPETGALSQVAYNDIVP